MSSNKSSNDIIIYDSTNQNKNSSNLEEIFNAISTIINYKYNITGSKECIEKIVKTTLNNGEEILYVKLNPDAICMIPNIESKGICTNDNTKNIIYIGEDEIKTSIKDNNEMTKAFKNFNLVNDLESNRTAIHSNLNRALELSSKSDILENTLKKTEKIENFSDYNKETMNNNTEITGYSNKDYATPLIQIIKENNKTLENYSNNDNITPDELNNNLSNIIIDKISSVNDIKYDKIEKLKDNLMTKDKLIAIYNQNNILRDNRIRILTVSLFFIILIIFIIMISKIGIITIYTSKVLIILGLIISIVYIYYKNFNKLGDKISKETQEIALKLDVYMKGGWDKWEKDLETKLCKSKGSNCKIVSGKKSLSGNISDNSINSSNINPILNRDNMNNVWVNGEQPWINETDPNYSVYYNCKWNGGNNITPIPNKKEYKYTTIPCNNYINFIETNKMICKSNPLNSSNPDDYAANNCSSI